MIRRMICGALLGLLTIGLGTASAVSTGTTTCTFDSRTVHLHLASEHVIRLFAVNGLIKFADLTNYAWKGQCGSATVNNADSVRVTETVAGRSRLQFDQQLGIFGPGRLAESTGTSEIEVRLGTLTDIWFMGTAARDVVVIGMNGVDFNGDGDVDLIGTYLSEVTAFLDDGDDLITAGGGSGTGEAWLPRATSGYL